MTSQTYVIWSNEMVTLGAIDGDKSLNKTVNITWGSGTTVTKATALISGETGSTSLWLRVRMNGNLLLELNWPFPFPGDRLKSGSIDVTSILSNGGNIFAAIVSKDPFFLLGADMLVNVSVIIEFTGPSPGMTPWWQPYVLPAIGIAGVAIGGAAVVTGRREKK